MASEAQSAYTLAVNTACGFDVAQNLEGACFKGRMGDALIFWNVTPHGAPGPRTLHMGSAPTSGEKWLFSQWIRLRV